MTSSKKFQSLNHYATLGMQEARETLGGKSTIDRILDIFEHSYQKRQPKTSSYIATKSSDK